MKSVSQVKSDFLKKRIFLKRLIIAFWATMIICIGLVVLYLLLNFPLSIVVYPVEKVYAIGDMSTDYYEVVMTPIIGKSRVLDNPNIDVKLDVDDYYEVTAHYFGMSDTVKIKPIAQTSVVVEYTDDVYFGDTIKKSKVKCYAVFEDGYEQDIPMTCQIPDGPVFDDFTIVVKTNDAMVHLLDISPIGVKTVDTSYADKLYDGDVFTSAKLCANVVFDDGFKRKLTDFTWNGNDEFSVNDDVIGTISTDFGEYDVAIKIIGVSSFDAAYAGTLYAGDEIDTSLISVSKVYTDGMVKHLDNNSCDFSNLTYAYGGMSEYISTDVGQAVFEPNVIGVRSVVCNLSTTDILEGTNIEPISFDIKFVDGRMLTVDRDSVKLSSDWTSAIAGMHDYSFTYNQNTLTCSIVAQSVDVVVPDVSVPSSSDESDTIDMNLSHSDDITLPSESTNQHDDGFTDTYDVD